jgi:hypothetical protein
MLVSMSCVTASHAQKLSTTRLSIANPAIEGVLAAFQKSPLVGMSDDHAFAQEEEFYISLISLALGAPHEGDDPKPMIVAAAVRKL